MKKNCYVYKKFINLVYNFFCLYSYAPAPSTVQIWLSDLSCTSSDTELERCHHSGVGNNDCDHSEDVAISCYKSESPVKMSVCSGKNYDYVH